MNIGEPTKIHFIAPEREPVPQWVPASPEREPAFVPQEEPVFAEPKKVGE